MFCPRCGTENGLEQGYCRQCGQALSDVRLSLEGKATQSLESLLAGSKWMNGGIAVIIVFTIIALFIAIGGVVLGHPTLSTIAMINVLLGALIGLPLVFLGTAQVRRATRLLSGSQNRIGQGGINRFQPPNDLLTTGLNQDERRVPSSASVTEHTTVNLGERVEVNYDPTPEQKRKE